jgi:predicted DNA-binding protein YlxM (UPF0122 family)
MKTHNNQKFTKDEEFGKWGEYTLIPFIEKYFNQKLPLSKIAYWYDSSYQASNKSFSERKSILKSYDLKFGLYENGNISPKKSVTFEIKTDKFMNTGNVVIEKKYKKQPSGVFGSSADYFIYFFPRRLKDQVYIIKRERLIEMFESDTKWNDYLRYGGDKDFALMYVIPSGEFEVEFLKSGGKLETYEVEIPEEFGLDKFTDNNISYVSNTQKTYEDPFDFN